MQTVTGMLLGAQAGALACPLFQSVAVTPALAFECSLFQPATAAAELQALALTQWADAAPAGPELEQMAMEQYCLAQPVAVPRLQRTQAEHSSVQPLEVALQQVEEQQLALLSPSLLVWWP